VTTGASDEAPAEERPQAACVAGERSNWLMAPAPAGRLNVVRLLTLGYALVWIAVRTGHWLDLSRLPSSRWEPAGLMTVVGSQRTAVVVIVVVLTVLAGIAAIGDVRWALSAPLFGVGVLWLTSFGASWGQILHTEHLVVLHVLVLATGPSGRGSTSTVGWPLKVMSAVTVATYFVAGVAKLRFGGGFGWLEGDELLRLVAHDNLRKRLLGDAWSPLAAPAVGHPWLFDVGAWLTVIVELGAPLALLGRRLAYAWTALAWCFHVAVFAVMAVLFPYPLVGIAFASMLPVERLAPAVRNARWLVGRKPAATAADR
jgi:hypothetical protein